MSTATVFGRVASAVVRAERGSATAEFAAVLPAVLVVLGLCLGSVSAMAQYTRLVDAAADAARAAGRGDSDIGASVARVDPAASVSSIAEGELVCVVVGVALHPLPAVSIPVSLRSCAFGGWR